MSDQDHIPDGFRIMVGVCADNHLHIEDPGDDVLPALVICRHGITDGGDVHAQCLTGVAHMISPEEAARMLEHTVSEIRAGRLG